LVKFSFMEWKDFQISEGWLLNFQIVDGPVCSDDACSALTGVYDSRNQQ